MPTTPTWWLEDAEARHAAAPSSFFIPPAAKRNSLVRGDAVKLLFGFEPTPGGSDGERMWVEVTATRGGTYVGSLLNEPRHIDSLHPGSEVEFEPRHVAAYDWPFAELGYDASKHAWVSAEIVRGTDRPLLASRRSVGNVAEGSDSGWTVGNGGEPDTGPKHFEWHAIGSLTDRFPELEPVFRVGVGDWRWDPREERYIRADGRA